VDLVIARPVAAPAPATHSPPPPADSARQPRLNGALGAPVPAVGCSSRPRFAARSTTSSPSACLPGTPASRSRSTQC
jgi:hypothetical protein